MINDIERATSAMLHLDPSMAESDWWRVAAAARAAGVEFDDFDRWSSAGQNYKNTQDCRATWNAHPPKPSGGRAAQYRRGKNPCLVSGRR